MAFALMCSCVLRCCHWQVTGMKLPANALPIQQWFPHPVLPPSQHRAEHPIHHLRSLLFHDECFFRWADSILPRSVLKRCDRIAGVRYSGPFLFHSCVCPQCWPVCCLAGRQQQFHWRLRNPYQSEWQVVCWCQLTCLRWHQSDLRLPRHGFESTQFFHY